MGQAIPSQHPAVVLRSHYNHLRALLVIAAIAVVGLTTAVVILANDDEPATSVSTATPAVAPSPTGERYDGGPEEGTAAISTSRAPVSRYDGGPEEGTAAISTSRPPVTRYDGGPEEGTAARAQSPAPAPAQSVTPPPSSIAASEGSAYGQLREAAPPQRYDGGPEEGTTGPGR